MLSAFHTHVPQEIAANPGCPPTRPPPGPALTVPKWTPLYLCNRQRVRGSSDLARETDVAARRADEEIKLARHRLPVVGDDVPHMTKSTIEDLTAWQELDAALHTLGL